MSINATVADVVLQSNGAGHLVLTGAERGQAALYFDSAPADVMLLKGAQVWGSADTLLHGESEFAEREGYLKIAFIVPSIGRVLDREKYRREQAG